MTEVERIINKGIITPSFLKAETRCGFYVNKKRKRIWTVELDLLIEFDLVCKKYGLRYFLGGGSLLGAVRHHGFIPWDDDLDVYMPRPDYEEFLKKATFKQPYFLQTPYTDKDYYYSFAKLRNSNTTAVSTMFSYSNMNQGIFIDIFPVDTICLDDGEEIYEIINKLNYDNSTYMRKDNPFLDDANKERVKKWPGMDPLKSFEKIQSLAASHQKELTGFAGNIVCTIYKYEKKVYKTSWIEKTVLLDFEMLKCPVPLCFNDCLKTTFGNYKIFPPKEKRGKWHESIHFDPSLPYKDFLKELRDRPNKNNRLL